MAGSTDEGSVLVLVEHLGILIGCYRSLSSRQDYSLGFLNINVL